MRTKLLAASLAAVATLALAAETEEQSTSKLTLSALEAYRKGDCRSAIPKLEALLARQPKNKSAQHLLESCRDGGASPAAGKAHSAAAGKPGAVVHSLNAPPPATPAATHAPAAPADPEAAERRAAGADFSKAELAIKQGRIDEAERLLIKTVQQSPTLVLPRLRLAEVYTRKQQTAKAAAIYEELAAQTASPVYVRRAAENLSWSGRHEESVKLYDRYIAAVPSDRAARLARANVLLWNKQAERAIPAFRELLALGAGDVQARSGLAHALLWSKQFPEALKEFETLQTQKPGDAQFVLGTAQALEQMGKPTAAEAQYLAILERDPHNQAAAEGRDRVKAMALLQSAFDAAGRGQFAESAALFEKHVQANPDDLTAVLQLARVRFWGEQYPDAAKAYRRYLAGKPGDETATRELARVELSLPDYASARQHYEWLAARPAATKEDLEGLISALVWSNDFDGAETWAKTLASRDKDNVVAADALRSLAERRKASTREKAQQLASNGRFPEAVDAYRDLETRFGADREAMLSVARIYGWDSQSARSVAAYQSYLNKYPDDTKARLEMGRVQQYAGDRRAADSTYRAVLQRNRNDAGALLGLAQTADQAGEDPFRVTDAYRSALTADRSLRVAEKRIVELIPEVSPSVGYRQRNFSDSDGFRRGGYTAEGSVPLRGGLRLTPFYRYNEMSQFRQVGGAQCTSGSALDSRLALLSEEICASEGGVRGHTAGMRVSVSPAGNVSFTAEASQNHFDFGRSRFNAQADLTIRPAADSAITLSYMRRDAVYDVNTIASLFGGVMGEGFYIAYRQPLSAKWHLSMQGGLTRYDQGTGGYSVATQQRRASATAVYRVSPSANAGYFMRWSSFNRATPLFFSPSLYAVAGATYDWNKRLSEQFSLLGEAQLGFGRMKRFEAAGLNVTEMSVYLGLAWRVRPDLALQLGYRLSRGVSSAFGSPVYSTGGLDFGMTNYFASPVGSVDPARIDVR